MLAVQQRSRELLTNLVKSRMHPVSTFETAQTAGPCPASDQRADRPFLNPMATPQAYGNQKIRRRKDLVLVRSFTEGCSHRYGRTRQPSGRCQTVSVQPVPLRGSKR